MLPLGIKSRRGRQNGVTGEEEEMVAEAEILRDGNMGKAQIDFIGFEDGRMDQNQ